MNHSLILVLDGQTLIHMEDTSAEPIAAALHLIAESIERFGIRHTLRVIERNAALRQIVFAEAQCGGAYESTVTGPQA